LNLLMTLDKDKLVYVDESGIDKFVFREYGWSKRGTAIPGSVSGKRYARESFIAGKLGTQIIAPFCYTGTCDTELFNMWLQKLLIPILEPGHIIIMDNASFHKSEKTKELITKAGCTLLFLPPYSPDFNPIEKFWANFKRKVRNTIQKYKSLSETIDVTFKEFCLN